MNPDELNYEKLQFMTTTKGEYIQFAVWGGRTRLGVVKKGEFKTIVEFDIHGAVGRTIRQTMTQVLKASPKSEFPMTLNKIEQHDRKYETVPDAALRFVKDDSNIIHIILKWGGVSYDAPIRGTQMISVGSDGPSPAERSAIAFEDLFQWLNDKARFMEVLTNKKRVNAVPSNAASQPPPSQGNRNDYNNADFDLF